MWDDHEMDAVERDELRALRARAYGPAADIHDDPAALRRLQELEPRASAPAPPSDMEVHDSESTSAPQGSALQPGRRRWIAIGAFWLLSVIVAAGVAWAVTFTTTYVPPVSASGAEVQVATLKPSS